jgi:hypothetical protein
MAGEVWAKEPLDILALNRWVSDYAWYSKINVAPQNPPQNRSSLTAQKAGATGATGAPLGPPLGAYACTAASALEEQWYVTYTAAAPISWANDSSKCIGLPMGAASFSTLGAPLKVGLVDCKAVPSTAGDPIAPKFTYDQTTMTLSAMILSAGIPLCLSTAVVPPAVQQVLVQRPVGGQQPIGKSLVMTACDKSAHEQRWKINSNQNPAEIQNPTTGDCVAEPSRHHPDTGLKLNLLPETTASVFYDGKHGEMMRIHAPLYSLLCSTSPSPL